MPGNANKEIFPDVLTSAEALDWRVRLSAIRDDFFRQSRKTDSGVSDSQAAAVLKKHIPQDLYDKWQRFFSEQKEDFARELENVLKEMEGYQRCEITVARPLSKAAYDRMLDWFRGQAIYRIILETKTDERIGGGALIAIGGRIYDYSLRKKIVADLKL